MASKPVPQPNFSVTHQRALISALIGLLGITAIASALVLTACSGASSSQFHGQTQTGVIVNSTIGCPTGFFSGSTPAVCQSANLAGCAGASNLNFIFSYDTPPAPIKGTIVLLTGAGGTDAPNQTDFASFYFSQGYEVIQVQWSNDWEDTTAPPQDTGNNDTTQHAANIQLAACRQATFLNYVFNSGNATLYSSGGRCAQGASAGSAAIAYSMTFYGAQNYLDAVEFQSGPPLSDIEQGCEEPNNIQISVCGAGTPTGSHCQLGGTSPWQLSPLYTQQATGVRNATNDNSCANGTTTSSASNAAWLKQSIVNDGTNNPTYNYPNTSMTAWLCQSVLNTDQCSGGCPGDGGQGGSPDPVCPNNSSSQAQIYFSKVTSNYTIYAVQNCDTAEGVDGTDATVAALSNLDGTDAIKQDMVAQCHSH